MWYATSVAGVEQSGTSDVAWQGIGVEAEGEEETDLDFPEL